MRPPLLGWMFVSAGFLAGAALCFLAWFAGIRVGESGARVMLDSLRASTASGMVVRLEDGRTFWITAPADTPRDTIRRRYVPKR